MPRQNTSKCRHFGLRPSLTGQGSRAGCDVKSRSAFHLNRKIGFPVGNQMEQVFPPKIFRKKREYLECFPFEWKNRFFCWETKWNRSFRRKFFEKRNTFRGIPLFSFSPKLPENHCTIYSITLVPCFLAKIRDSAREWRPPSCLSFQYAVFILNKRNVI